MRARSKDCALWYHKQFYFSYTFEQNKSLRALKLSLLFKTSGQNKNTPGKSPSVCKLFVANYFPIPSEYVCPLIGALIKNRYLSESHVTFSVSFCCCCWCERSERIYQLQALEKLMCLIQCLFLNTCVCTTTILVVHGLQSTSCLSFWGLTFKDIFN